MENSDREIIDRIITALLAQQGSSTNPESYQELIDWVEALKFII